MKKIILFPTILFAICFDSFLFAQTTPGKEKHVSKPFYEDFNGPIDKNKWAIGTWNEHGGQLSPERCYVKNGMLHMVFINDSDKGYLGSAIQTADEFLYGKWEARIRPSNIPGVLNSFYTIDWDNTANDGSSSDGTKQEIDIEFLTKSFTGSSGEVHLAVHARGRKSYNSNPDFRLDFDPSADFHVFGFEITPEYIEWFADGKAIYRYVYKENDIVIDAPYMLKLNAWTSQKWVGGPPKANTECVYLIDWIRFTPYKK